MAYDYEAAIAAGAKPDDIISYLSKQNNYDSAGAIKAGARPEDVLKYLSMNTSAPVAKSDAPQDSTYSGFLGTNPNDSIYGKIIDNSLTRGIQNFFPGKKVGEAIGTAAGAIVAKGKDIANKTNEFGNYDLSAPSPEAVIGDVAKGASMVAGARLPVAPSILGKAAQFGALGASSAAGEAMTKDASIGDISKEALKGGAIGAGTGAAFGAVEKGFRALGNVLGNTGDRIQMSVIKPSQADISDGFSIDNVKKYNLGGSLKQVFDKTSTQLDELSSQLNQKLASTKTAVDLNDVYENTAKRLLGNKLENFGSNTPMENAIEKLRNEIVAVSGQNGIVTVPEAQLIKRASGHFGAWTFGVPDPETTASQKVYNTFYNEIKKAIEDSSPAGVKEINKKISELIPIANAVIRRIPIAERNAVISLKDMISLGSAAIEPRALSLTLLNLASKSGRVGSYLGKAASALGNKAARAVEGVESVTKTGIAR